jgi:hypothetical protein
MAQQQQHPAPQYKLGDVVNGHVLTQQGWVPLAQAQQPYPQPQQINITQQVAGAGKSRTSHGLHLFLTIITAGLWAPVWIIVTIVNRGK